MFEFIAVVVLANLIMLAVLYVLRHVIAIRAPVLILAVGISIIYCILYPFLVILLSYPQVLYLYVFLVVAGAGSLYLIENRFFAVRELNVAERPAAAGAIEYIPEAGLPVYLESEADDPSAGPESADVPVEDTPVIADKAAEGHITADEVAALLKAADAGETKGAEEDISFYKEDEIAAAEEGPGSADVPEEDMPVMADKAAEGHITEDEVAALLKAADTGEPKGAAEDITFYTEDEIAAVEEGLDPADVQVGGVPDRDDLAVGEITATLEGLDETGPVETMEEAWFTGSDEKESHIGIEEFLPAEEESVLAYEEKTEVPDGEWLVPVTGLPEGLEPETSGMAAIPVEDVPGLADETMAGYITEDEAAAILEDAAAGEPESGGEDISFYGPEEAAVFAERPEPAELSVADIPGWDDAAADEITATLEGLDMGAAVLAAEEAGLTGVDVSATQSLIDELLPVEQESDEQAAAGAEEEHGDIAELMEEPDYVPAQEQSPPGDDLNSLVAMAFDKLASGDGTGAVDSFFRALKLGPPPRLAVLLCTRISSIYSSQGLSRQALAVMEMLEVVWGPMLDDSQREGITTIIIQLRGEV